MASPLSEDLLGRLLSLFPVKLLREEFEVSGSSQNQLIQEVLENNTPETITNFAFDSFDLTKQHVHISCFLRDFDLTFLNENEFPYTIHKQIRADDGIIIYCLPIVNYAVRLDDPYSKEILQFVQPLKITIENKKLILQFTILEKDIKALYPVERFINSKRDIDESFIKSQIIDYFSSQYLLVNCDLNKGIKHLWNTDVIDSRFVKFKKDKSTTTEAMDEDETYKKNYPVEFADMMKRPLSRTILTYMGDDDELCENFVVDPSKGEINFSKFPKSETQVQNVLTKILTNN